jgi:hypothetical protein
MMHGNGHVPDAAADDEKKACKARIADALRAVPDPPVNYWGAAAFVCALLVLAVWVLSTLVSGE